MNSDSWTDRLLDGYADFEIMSLTLVFAAILLGILAGHFYFRWRLEPAVNQLIPPRTVRLEALAVGLAIGALIAAFSGWGFLWIVGILAMAFALAAMAGARRLILVVVAILILAVLVTLGGWKINAL
jgi:hypothetical protein